MWDFLKLMLVVGLVCGLLATWDAFDEERWVKFAVGAVTSVGVIAALALVPVLRVTP